MKERNCVELVHSAALARKKVPTQSDKDSQAYWLRRAGVELTAAQRSVTDQGRSRRLWLAARFIENAGVKEA